MFETEVYKNCYPFSRESLLDFDKRRMILKLLNTRRMDLYGADYEAKRNGRKIRIQLLNRIEEERAKIEEIRTHIENNITNNPIAIYFKNTCIAETGIKSIKKHIINGLYNSNTKLGKASISALYTLSDFSFSAL